jgi:spermidine/putrescine-binding protein
MRTSVTTSRGLLALLAVGALTACGGSSGKGGSAAGDGGSTKLVIAGYGGPTPGAFKQHVLTPFNKTAGVSTSWAVVPGGIVAGVRAQQQSGNIQWDMGAEMQGSEVETLARLGFLAELPASLQSQAKTGGISDATKYALPWSRGASLIVCNAKAVKRCPTTPQEFFDAKAFPGARMFSSFQPETALAFAAEASGVAANAIWPLNLQQAEAKLKSIRSQIKTFYNSGDQAAQLLRSGEVPIALFWNANTQKLTAQASSTMQLKVSWTGAVLFNTYMAVFKKAPNQKNAFKLLSWILSTPSAMTAENLAEGGTPSLPAAAEKLPAADRAWAPGVGDHTGLAGENDAWYLDNQKTVDDFWKSFTSG